MKSDLYGRNYFKKIHKIVNPERELILAGNLRFLFSKKKDVSRILDVGCGLGEFLGQCDYSGMQTFGLEISEFALSFAKKNTKANLKKWDVSGKRWPFNDNFFDAVCIFDVLEHVKNPAFVLSEAYRVLRIEGIFLATTPNGNLEKSKIRKKLLPYDPTHINVHTEQFWRLSFEKARLKNFRSRGCLFFGFPPTPSLRQKLKKFGIKSYTGPIFFPIKSLCATLYLWGFKS